MEIIKFILLLLAIYVLWRITRLIYKRASFTLRLKRLARSNERIKLRFTRNSLLSLIKMSHAPDLTVEVGNKIYLVRFYNGRGSRTQVHFANAEYSASFAVLAVRAFGLASKVSNLGRGGGVGRPQSTTSIFTRVKIIPRLEKEQFSAEAARGKETVPVFIFNPAPANVSYVSEERTSIKLAFTGDVFLDTMIFTGSTFLSYIEREARHTGGYDERVIFHTDMQ